MKSLIALSIGLFISLASYHPTLAASGVSDKVFKYQGDLTIRDDRTGKLVKEDGSATNQTVSGMTEQEQSEAEAACWKLINEQSVVTFALQERVLNDLKSDLDKLDMEDEARLAVEKIMNRMRQNMQDALEALKKDAADEYFDSLFEASEDIIYLSTFLRNPKLDDNVFLILVKAVSRLGRNNSALIQDFTQMCSFIQRSSRPRGAIASNSK